MTKGERPIDEPSIRDFLFDFETAQHLAIYAAIGRFVVVWGQVEMNFNVVVMQLRKAKSDVDEPVPELRTMPEKIRFFQSAAPDRSDQGRIADEIRRLCDLRNTVLHTNWSEMTHNPSNPVRGGSIQLTRSGVKAAQSALSAAEVVQATMDADQVNALLLPLMFHLQDQPPPRP